MLLLFFTYIVIDIYVIHVVDIVVDDDTLLLH